MDNEIINNMDYNEFINNIVNDLTPRTKNECDSMLNSIVIELSCRSSQHSQMQWWGHS